MTSFPSPPVEVPSHNTNTQRVYRLAPHETSELNAQIMRAVNDGSYEEVRHLLRNVLSVSTRGTGSTPLHIAASRGDMRIASELLRVGYDVNVADQTGMTPLRMALQNGHIDCARLLQEAGGGISAQELANPVTDDELDALTSSMLNGMSAPNPSYLGSVERRGMQSMFGVPQSPVHADLSALMSLEQQLDTVRLGGDSGAAGRSI